VELLLKAFKPVFEQTGAILEIVGDGELRQSLQQQAAELGLGKAVIFRGWLSQPKQPRRCSRPTRWFCQAFTNAVGP